MEDIFEEIGGAITGVVAGGVAGKITKNTIHTVLDTPKGEDEMVDMFADFSSLDIAITTGLAVSDLFGDDD